MVIVDSFSGAAAALPRGKRTAEHVLEALRRDPRVSTWDMGDCPWLRRCIGDLKRDGLIEDVPEGYPWLRYRATGKQES